MEGPQNIWLHRFARLVAGATLVLLAAGASVTSTGSGLAVPDWPLSFGQFFPPMVGGVLFEHGHRMIAGVVLVLTTILTVWIFREEKRVWVKRVAGFALIALVAQALLGGLTVLFKLPTPISVSHAGLAQIFFCLTIGIAMFTSPRWRSPGQSRQTADATTLRRLALATTLVIYIQILVGAVMRHMGAGLAIPDFPLSYGGLFPPYFSTPILIHFAHRVGALAVTVVVIWLGVRVVRDHREDTLLVRPAIVLMSALGVQVFLGALTIWTRRAVIPTTAHVAVGAVVLAASLVLTLRVYRFLTTVVADPAPAAPEPAEDSVPRGTRPVGALRWNSTEWSGVMMRNETGPVSAIGSTIDNLTGVKSGLQPLRDYLELTKPRIVVMVLLTTLAGFYLGAFQGMDLTLLFHTLIGTGLVIGSANALNQLMERDTDAKMHRTRNRPLPAGRVSPQEVLYTGIGMAIVGTLYLVLGVNALTAFLALAAWAVYLFLYTPLKRRTSLSTLVGAISGALPPVIGWAAVRRELSVESLALFAILFVWQLPHFLAIASMYRDDYARGGFPMLPVLYPEGTETGRQIVIYCLAMVPISLMPTVVGLAGIFYFAGALILTLGFLMFGIRAAVRKSRVAARHLLFASLLFLPALLTLMMLDRGRF